MKQTLLKKRILSLSILALFLGAFNVTHAQYTNTWVGGTNTDFLDATNWTAALTATPFTPGAVTFASNTTFVIGVGSPNNPVLSTNYPGTTSNGLTVMPSGVLSTSGNINLGGSTSYTYIDGQLTVTGGNFNVRANLYIANSASATSSTVNIQTGGTLNVKNVAYVGRTKSGTLNVNGGTFSLENQTVGGVTVGTASSVAAGVININSGLVKVNKVAGLTILTYGTVNVGGGTLELVAGDLTNRKVININGGLMNLLVGASSINTAVYNASVAVGATAAQITAGNEAATSLININSGTLKVAGTLTISSGTVNIDGGKIELTGNQTAAMAAYIGANTIKVSGAALAAGKTISNTYNAITNLTTVTATTTIWDGSTWSNGTPDSTLEAVITGTYATGTNGDITAKKLTVSSGSLTINSGGYVNVANEVVNNAGAGGIVIENDANLIQVNNTTNTGNAAVKRNSNPLSRLDYTLWSSPVANQNLLAFSPLTSNTSVVTTPITTVNRFYTYDSATNFYVAIPDPAFATTTFAKGKGYLIRMPNTAVAAPGTETFNGVFTGVLNNGDINLTGLTPGQYVAVGNPYPSNIRAIDFINANLDALNGGTLYLWRKKNGEAIVTSAYATMNKTGVTVGASTGDVGILPNGYIAVGQGFITTVPPSGTIAFNNGMRTTNTTTFLRTKAAAQPDRVWINLTNTDGAFSQMLVGYMDGATTGFDAGIDGKYINDAATALTSDIAGEEYVIQGRPVFSDTDVVNLNFKAIDAGTYTIAKDHVDGLFATGQDIYLVDKTTGTETNLQKEAYTFTAAAGVNNTRFQLTYKTSASLKVNDLAFDENSISVYKQNGVLNINAGNTTMKSVKVFDFTGRLVLEQKSVNATTTSLRNLAAVKQALLIQITSDDNRVVTKKAIN